MSSAMRSAAVLLVAVYLLSSYKGASVETPDGVLHPQGETDVKRYRHDGTQPPSERLGNLSPAIEWPEVSTLLS